jgi:hypothetical protein
MAIQATAIKQLSFGFADVLVQEFISRAGQAIQDISIKTLAMKLVPEPTSFATTATGYSAA